MARLEERRQAARLGLTLKEYDRAKRDGMLGKIAASRAEMSPGETPVNKTTPSGRVAAKQRAKAASDTPLKNTTQKKPTSNKNDASPDVESQTRALSDEKLDDLIKQWEPLQGQRVRGARTALKSLQAERERRSAGTTPSGAVGATQRKKAVSDSPIAAQLTKAPKPRLKPASGGGRIPGASAPGSAMTGRSSAEKAADDYLAKVQSYNPKTGPTTAQKKSNAAKMGKDPNKVKSGRKLSTDPKQVARRAKRGFPSGH